MKALERHGESHFLELIGYAMANHGLGSWEGRRQACWLSDYPRYCNYLFLVADISFFRLTINPAVKMLELRCMCVFDRGPLNWISL